MSLARSGHAIAAIFLVTSIGLAQTTTPPAPPSSSQASQPDQRRQLEEFYNSHYTKHEYRVPMRDGVKLYTVVYTPIAEQFADHGPYPFLMSRTPYSCGNYGNKVLQPHVTNNPNLIHDGYILVCQDVRGRWDSEGHWLEMTPSKDGKGIDESTDMYDTVDWLLKNIPSNNGKVGILGISYPGFYAAASIVDSHPAIKAASPQAPIMDLWMGDDSYHGGAFMLDANHSFYAPFSRRRRTRSPRNPGASSSSPLTMHTPITCGWERSRISTRPQEAPTRTSTTRSRTPLTTITGRSAISPRTCTE